VRSFGTGWNLLLLGALIVLGGCALMPASGPSSWDMYAGQHNAKSLPYALVKVTPKVTAVLAQNAPRLTHEFEDHSRPSDIRFGIGDIVSVTIFEAASGGLFIPAEAGVRPGNFINIPNQQVDTNGNISIPYAGAIRARGRTPVEVQNAIVEALKNRAIEPQAVVSVVEQRTSMITILGDVLRSSRIPASATPERLLDTIARAGGPASAGVAGSGNDLWVMLERNGKRSLAPFGALVYEPVNNIYVHPNDTIFVYRDPQTYLTFGATGAQQQIPFNAWRLTVAEALAKAGGLIDQVADPAAVFLYRGETREVAQAMGIDCTPFPGPIIPVIYNFNFRDPAGYFHATSFEVRNKDVIFASNAVSVEASKFMVYLNLINSTVNDPIQTATAVYALKNIARGTGQTAVLTGGSSTVIAPPAPTPTPTP
jgi:polysaccharide export outer membrane protein